MSRLVHPVVLLSKQVSTFWRSLSSSWLKTSCFVEHSSLSLAGNTNLLQTVLSADGIRGTVDKFSKYDDVFSVDFLRHSHHSRDPGIPR